MIKKTIWLILFSLIFVNGCSASGKSRINRGRDISPLSFGLLDARSDIERYNVLLTAHKEAVERGVGVNYSGIKSINIEVPDKNSTIPISSHTDFRGCVINVRNNVGDVVLFSRVKTAKEIDIPDVVVDSGIFESISALKKGMKLLVLEDQTPWVENREGYGYSAFRKDILVLKEGKALNSPIMPYCTKQTVLKCSYVNIEDTIVSISNVVINRTTDSRKKTYGFLIKGSYNVQLKNITVNTPEGTGLWADGIIKIRDCAHVIAKSIKINGTYSLKDKYGYGFELDNVYDFLLCDSYGHGNWGVFGSNNMNGLNVKKCNLNRVDIHLYGRNVHISDSKLSQAYNQFSGVYGEIIMERCRFSDFIPLINGTSYNTYVPYDLYIKECEWDVTEKKNILLRIGLLQNTINKREELAKKSWPNIYIDGLSVNIPNGLESIILVELGTDVSYPYAVGNICAIHIKNLSFNYNNNAKERISLILCNKPVTFENKITCNFENIKLLNKCEKDLSQSKTEYDCSGAIIYNIHSNKGEIISVNNSILSFGDNSNYQYDITYNNCVISNIGLSPSIAKYYLTKRREYNGCKLYLNIVDGGKYYLDNLASYHNCNLFPLNNFDIDFNGPPIDLKFDNCYIGGGKRKQYYRRNNMTRKLINSSFDGESWSLY